MGLRKNIAELNNEIINLRKNLYIANPNIDVGTFVKDSLPQRKET
jgi:hypothetical protein